MPPLVVFVRSINGLWRFSLEGPAGAFGEFTNDINAICAIRHCCRALVIGESWTAREKLSCPGRVYDWDN
jgi:hypothetical protein